MYVKVTMKGGEGKLSFEDGALEALLENMPNDISLIGVLRTAMLDAIDIYTCGNADKVGLEVTIEKD